MKNIKALLKLDFRLLAPYWKWWLLFLGISLLIGIINRNGIAFMFSLILFAGTMMAFPFESTDKSNLSILYAILPTNRKSMVVSRYIFMLLTMAVALAVGLVGGLIIDASFWRIGWGGNIIAPAIALSFALYMVAVGFQTPFFYRFGYIKGRIFMWIPIIVATILMMLPLVFNLFNIETDFDLINTLFRNHIPTTLVSIGVGLVSLVASFLTSVMIYLKRDI